MNIKVWILPAILSLAVFVILVLGVVNNSNKVDKLEQQKSFVFYFSQNGERFQAFCEEGLNTPTIYTCNVTKIP